MIDQADISVLSGKGGNGAVSGRREKFVPLGGPDGGDGGEGGSVVLRCDEGINTLREFSYNRKFSAESGGGGKGRLKHGANGKDVTVAVPVGTEIWVGDGEGEWQRTADMLEHGQQVFVARGGRGGRGNASYSSPTNRYPLLAEEGEPGEDLTLRLKLKLLADVGIVGVPNVGKSSLLAAVSAAKPKVAAYPFTTIDPMLGVVDHRDQSFVIVDIPGLIEGAHEGVGLGHQFLSHVERTRVLVHLLDGTSDDAADDYRKVRSELTQFDDALLEKPEIVAVNKIDVPGAEARCSEVGARLEGDVQEVKCISAVGRQGLDELLDAVLETLAAIPVGGKDSRPDEGAEPVVLRPRQHERPEVARTRSGSYVVSYRPAERLAALVNSDNWDARIQLYEQMRRMGVVAALEKAGIESGDAFRVGKLEWEWE